MWTFIVTTLRDNPHIAIFLTLAVGYWIGNKRFGSFSLGAVTGTLLAGVVIGQLGIEVSGQVVTAETIGFMRKLDVKEIHGFERAKGLKLIRPDHAGKNVRK